MCKYAKSTQKDCSKTISYSQIEKFINHTPNPIIIYLTRINDEEIIQTVKKKKTKKQRHKFQLKNSFRKYKA